MPRPQPRNLLRVACETACKPRRGPSSPGQLTVPDSRLNTYTSNIRSNPNHIILHRRLTLRKATVTTSLPRIPPDNFRHSSHISHFPHAKLDSRSKHVIFDNWDPEDPLPYTRVEIWNMKNKNQLTTSKPLKPVPIPKTATLDPFPKLALENHHVLYHLPQFTAPTIYLFSNKATLADI